MKNIIILKLLLCFQFMFPQVGVGTTAPTKDLDINGQLRIRETPLEISSTSILTTDGDGNITKNKVLLLIGLYTDVADIPVDVHTGATNNFVINNVNLGIENTVTIPAGVISKVILNYSVPVGTSNICYASGYLGVKFLKNGLEVSSGSRKYTIPQIRDWYPAKPFQMISITNTYIETIDNTLSTTDLIVTYSLKGYIEQSGSWIPSAYRFNMWSPVDPNYNWGRATMSTQVYIE